MARLTQCWTTFSCLHDLRGYAKCLKIYRNQRYRLNRCYDIDKEAIYYLMYLGLWWLNVLFHSQNGDLHYLSIKEPNKWPAYAPALSILSRRSVSLFCQYIFFPLISLTFMLGFFGLNQDWLFQIRLRNTWAYKVYNIRLTRGGLRSDFELQGHFWVVNSSFFIDFSTFDMK